MDEDAIMCQIICPQICNQRMLMADMDDVGPHIHFSWMLFSTFRFKSAESGACSCSPFDNHQSADFPHRKI